MAAKNSLTLNKEFIEYCKLNKIEDVEGFANEVFQIGFNFKKYGVKPGKPLTEGPITNKKEPAKTPKPEIIPAPQKTKKSLYDE